MKTSEERHYAPGGVDLVALWETGDNLGGAPVFKGKAKPGANRWVRRAGALPTNWAAVAAGLMVLTMVPFMAQEGSRPPALDEGSALDGVLGVDPFVAEAGAGAMSPGFPSDGSDVQRAQDPSLMVLGPERPGVATAAAPTSAPTAPASKASGATDWAAALKNAVRTAAPAAVKKAGLPSPSARLTGALKALAGGAGSSASKSTTGPGEALRLSAPSSKDLLSSFKAMDSLQLRRSEPLLRSMARGGSVPSSISQGGATFNSSARPSGGATASENLRDAVSAFGSPSANGQGGGGPAVFDGGKGPGANPAGVAKAPGESLEFTRRKMEMEKEMDLKYAKRKYNELGRQEMLDKVNAESAAKMKETVAGKMIDGAFGLAQKAMGGGEGGGKGGGESAVEANERAEAERQRLAGTRAPLKDTGQKVGETAKAISNDKFLGHKFSRPLGDASINALAAERGDANADVALQNAHSQLTAANKATGQANQATERQLASADQYVEAAQARINAWNIMAFVSGPSVGQALNQESDAKARLGESDKSRQGAEQSILAAVQAVNSSPQGTQQQAQEVSRAVQSVSEQKANYDSLGKAVGEVNKVGDRIVTSHGATRSAIEVRRQAANNSMEARQLAEAADQSAGTVRSGLKAFDAQLDPTAATLQLLSEKYKASLETMPAFAETIRGQFEMTKGYASANLASRKAEIPAAREKLQNATNRLNGKGG